MSTLYQRIKEFSCFLFGGHSFKPVPFQSGKAQTWICSSCKRLELTCGKRVSA